MGALLSPTNREHKAGGIRWGLVALTTVMFWSSSTALVLNLDVLFLDYLGWKGILPVLPGPLGTLFSPTVYGIVLMSMISLDQWLADGLLVSCVSKPVVRAS